jgi:type VI secretion system secreted protein VgrG
VIDPSDLTVRTRSLQDRYEDELRLSTPYELLAGPFGSGDLTVRSFRGTEEMSRCFRFDVEFHADADLGSLRAALMGRGATLLMHTPRRVARAVHGVVVALRADGVLPSTSGASVYTARVVPRLWLLRHRRNSRIHQDLSFDGVLDKIFDAASLARRWVLERHPRPREYCVQYEESDHDFVLRQLATAGVHFHFEPPAGLAALLAQGARIDAAAHAEATAEGEVMVLSDSTHGYGALAGDASARGSSAVLVLRNRAAVDELATESAVTALTLERRLRPKSVTLRDHDFKRPGMDLSSHVALPTGPDAAGRLRALLGDLAPPVDPRRLEYYEHHGEHEEPDAGIAHEALRVLQQLRADALVGAGTSLCRRLSAGYRFTLDEHAVPSLNREYVVTRVEHRGVVPGHGDDLARAAVYENRFHCVPSEVVARPAARPRRVQQVVEVATVTGPAGEDIHTDALGRIKVQFPWDRDGRMDASSSCWMRVTQSWAGAAWGAQFIPRVGMEVLVTFIGGDVDRPAVIGSAYNGANAPPFGLPHHRSRSGWRTHSTPGGAGFNELSFEDLAGREQVHLHAQRDLDVVVERDRTVEVRHDERVTVHHDRREEVRGDRYDEVRGARASVTDGDRSTLDRSDRSDVVEGDRIERIGGDAAARVGGASRLEVHGPREATLADDDLTRVKGSSTTVVGAHDAQRTWTVHAEGTARVVGTTQVEVSSDKELVLRCGQSVLRLLPDRIEMTTPSLVMTGGNAGITVEKDQLRVRAKSTMQVVAKSVVLKSVGASLGLTTDAHLDGQRVLLKSPQSASDPVEPVVVPPTRIEVRDQFGHPMARQRYRVVMDDGSERCGVLDDEGRAELELEVGGSIEFPDLREVSRG